MNGIAVRILSVLVTLAAVHAARAEYLYWMIDDASLKLEGSEELFGDYAYARVKDQQTGTYLSVYDASGSKTSATAVDKSTAISGPMVWGDFEADYSSSVSTFSSSEKSILFELYNSDRDVVAWQSVSLAELIAKRYIGDSLNPAFTPYMLTAVVPEPTGGVLVLLGAAMLALRRRRQCA